MNYGFVFRKVTIGIALGLLMGAFAMSFIDIDGVNVIACLSLVFAVMACATEDEINDFIKRVQCDGHVFQYNKCVKCGKLLRGYHE